MLAVVKKHRTDHPLFEIKGEIPVDIIEYLKSKFPEDIQIIDEEDRINIFNSAWFAAIEASTTPGEVVKMYRENNNFTQKQLGEKLGKFTRQNVSDIEHGLRGISKEIALKLSTIFNVGVERFIV